jgi:hypothetical protein
MDEIAGKYDGIEISRATCAAAECTNVATWSIVWESTGSTAIYCTPHAMRIRGRYLEDAKAKSHGVPPGSIIS